MFSQFSNSEWKDFWGSGASSLFEEFAAALLNRGLREISAFQKINEICDAVTSLTTVMDEDQIRDENCLVFAIGTRFSRQYRQLLLAPDLDIQP